MNRRRRGLTAAAIGLVALLVVAAPAGAKDRAERPNVIVVMADDQDFRSLSAMPQTRKLIARQGTRFEQAIVNFPLCCPSRATFLSGQYAHNHGVIWNNAPLGGYSKLDGTQTVPVWLQRAGYRTIHIGKYLNEYGEADPLEIPPGWSDWHGGVDPSTYDYYGYTLNNNGKLRTYGRTPSDYSTDVYGALAERAIHTAAGKDKPFFLSLAPNAPHTVAVETRARVEGTPALPAPRHADVYADASLPRYPNFDEADLSDKPTTLSDFFPDPFTADEIDALHRPLPGPDGIPAGGRRDGRRSGRGASANRRVREHGDRLHLRQRLDPRRAPAARPGDPGRPRRGRQVRALRGLLASALDDRRPRLPGRPPGARGHQQRRPRADDPRPRRRAARRRRCRSTASRCCARLATRTASTAAWR